MSRFVFQSVCLAACLLQAVFGQYSSCGCGSGLASGAESGWPATTYSAVREWPAATYSAPIGLPTATYGAAGSLAGPAFSPGLLPEAYTATGTGQVAAAGELLVAGSTLVAGRVPVSGATIFEGNVPAAGSVSISGHCGCNCYNDGIYY